MCFYTLLDQFSTGIILNFLVPNRTKSVGDLWFGLCPSVRACVCACVRPWTIVSLTWFNGFTSNLGQILDLRGYICTSFHFQIRIKMADWRPYLCFSPLDPIVKKHVASHISDMHEPIHFKCGSFTRPKRAHMHIIWFSNLIQDGQLVAIFAFLPIAICLNT